jgi:hypothetical protein
MKLGYNHLITLPPHQLDIAVSCSLTTISFWRRNNYEAFRVVHDRSSPMAKEKWLWDIIVNPLIQNCEVGYDRRKIIFPLNIKETILADSKDYIQLQFADILAGAGIALYRSKLYPNTKTDYSSQLENAGLSDFLIGGIWPSKHIDPEALETVEKNMGDPIEFIQDLIGHSSEEKS